MRAQEFTPNAYGPRRPATRRSAHAMGSTPRGMSRISGAAGRDCSAFACVTRRRRALRAGTIPGLYATNRHRLTHAWLPQAAFDEIVEEDGWILARKGDGYLALRSQQPYRWGEARHEGAPCEVIAEGKENVWLCKLGRRAVDGSLNAFRRRIAAALLVFGHLCVRYQSPSQGLLEFAWRAPPAPRRQGSASARLSPL